MEVNSRSSTFKSLQAAVRTATASAAGSETEHLLRFLPCFPRGVKDKRSLTGIFFFSFFFFIYFILKSSLCAFETFFFSYLLKGSGEYKFYFLFPFAPSVQRLSKRVWQPKYPAGWRASSFSRSEFPQMAVTPLSLVSLVYLRNRFEKPCFYHRHCTLFILYIIFFALFYTLKR